MLQIGNFRAIIAEYGFLVHSSQFWLTILCIFLVWIAVSFSRFLAYRRSFKTLHGPLKAPPFSILFGTVPAIAEIFKSCPRDSHPQCLFTLLHRNHGLGAMYYLDNWPAYGNRQLMINDPALAAQVTQTNSLPKHPDVKRFVRHLCGETSMIFAEGAEWKSRHALFAPGFSAGHLLTLMGSFVDDTLVFWQILAGKDPEEVFKMEDAAARLTIDIMGHVVLDHSLNSQTTDNELVSAFRSAVEWTPGAMGTKPLSGRNPYAKFMRWSNARRMDSYLGKIVDERYSNRDAEKESVIRRKPALDLAIDEFAAQHKELGLGPRGDGVDSTFKQIAIDQMKTFIFAGHDTSSSTICYIYHLLNLHPTALAKVRAEHDKTFGKETSAAANLLKSDPHLINKLPYTLAVIKETLRLFPAATSVRKGSPSIPITYNNHTYPTENFMVWINNHCISRRSDLYPSPDSFIPERFLPYPDNYQDVPKDAWRPFEKGLRACIGRELALIEMKVIMVLTLRDFDVGDAYEAFDRAAGREEPGGVLGGRRGTFGYRAYQVLIGSAKPVDGMPVTCRRRVHT